MMKHALKALCAFAFVLVVATPALAIDKVKAGQWQVYANGLYAKRQYDQALNGYINSLKLDNTNAGAYQGLGNCYYAKGDKANALKYYKYSLQLNPGNTQLAGFIARLQGAGVGAPAATAANPLANANALYTQRRYKEAITAYNAALGVNPNDARAYQGLGNCYYALKDKPNASASYRRALQINPNNTQLRSFLAVYDPQGTGKGGQAGQGGWGQSLWRSALLPGWGQVYNGETTKGYVVGGTTLALLGGGLVTYFMGASARAEYENMGEGGDFDGAYGKWESMATINHIFNIGFYLAYTYNLIDAVWNAKEAKHTASLDMPVTVSLLDDGMRVNYRLLQF